MAIAGLSLSKRAREVEANKKLAQGIRQLGKAKYKLDASL